MAGDRLSIDAVVDLGEEMMQRFLVGAADIHAGAATHRLQPFENLDIGSRIAATGRCNGSGCSTAAHPLIVCSAAATARFALA